MTGQPKKYHPLFPWFMWALCALFYCYEFFLQASMGVMVPDLMKAFSATGTQIGNLSSLYFYAYASMQIPVGILLDNLGAKRLLTIAAATCALGSLIFGSAHTFGIAAIGRILIGFGSAFAAIGCFNIAATWLPLKRFALLTGLMLTIGMLGAVGAQKPAALLVDSIGWRHAMLSFSVVGLIIATALYFTVRDKKIISTATDRADKSAVGLFNCLVQVVRSKQTWITAVYGGLMYLPTATIGTLWGVSFLMQSQQLTKPSAAGLVSMCFIGWAIGAPFFGWLSDRIGLRKTPMIIGSIGTLISITAVIYMPNLPTHASTILTIGCLLFTFGFFTSGFLPVFSVVREINRPENNATSLGFTNMFNMIGGAMALPLVGLLLDISWKGAMQGNIRFYSLTNYHHALAVVPICVGLSLLLLPFIKETYCKPSY